MPVPRDNYATGILAHSVILVWVDPETGTYPVRKVTRMCEMGSRPTKV